MHINVYVSLTKNQLANRISPVLIIVDFFPTPWWCHQMETFSALLAICAGNSLVPGEFPTQRPVTRSFDVFFDLRLIKWLRKQSWGWWFETLSRPLWHYCNDWIDITYSGAWDYHNQIVDSYTTFLSVSSLSIGLCTAVCTIQYRETMWSRFM